MLEVAPLDMTRLMGEEGGELARREGGKRPLRNEKPIPIRGGDGQRLDLPVTDHADKERSRGPGDDGVKGAFCGSRTLSRGEEPLPTGTRSTPPEGEEEHVDERKDSGGEHERGHLFTTDGTLRMVKVGATDPDLLTTAHRT
jgi:hypothetical protein